MSQHQARTIFFCEIDPEHVVKVELFGDFNSDVWHALNEFLRRRETQRVPENTGQSTAEKP